MNDFINNYANLVTILSFIFAISTYIHFIIKERKLRDTLKKEIIDRAKKIKLIITNDIKDNIRYKDIPDHLKVKINEVDSEIGAIITNQKYLN